MAADANARSLRELTKESRDVVLDQQLQVGPDDVFLDFGCGRGLVMLDALERCRVAVGVELNKGMLPYLERAIKERGWSVVRSDVVEGDGRAYRLERCGRDALLIFLVGNLAAMLFDHLERRCGRDGVSWNNPIKIYWYGTIMPKEVKQNVCTMLNAFPSGTRLAYVHLPIGTFDENGILIQEKTRDPLFDYGLEHTDWEMKRATWTSRADHLLTESGQQCADSYTAQERVASFLYVKGDDQSCEYCGDTRCPGPFDKTGTRCPKMTSEDEEKRRRRWHEIQDAGYEAEADALKELRGLTKELRTGRLTQDDVACASEPSHDEGEGESLSSDEDAKDAEDDQSDTSSEGSVSSYDSQYAPDSAPPDRRLKTDFMKKCADRAHQVINDHYYEKYGEAAATPPPPPQTTPKRTPPSAAAAASPCERAPKPPPNRAPPPAAAAASAPPAPKRRAHDPPPDEALGTMDRSGKQATYRCSKCEEPVRCKGLCTLCTNSESRRNHSRSRVPVNVKDWREAVVDDETVIPVVVQRSSGEWQYARIERSTTTPYTCWLIISRKSAGGRGEYTPDASIRKLWSLLKECSGAAGLNVDQSFEPRSLGREYI